MNPDLYPEQLAMGWGLPVYGPSHAEQTRRTRRREELHRRAVDRRRKAKRGGKR